jgi:hypothetical protein
MPWLAIDYDQLSGLPSVQKLGGKSIPSLLVLSDDSRLLASTYNGDEYLGPESVLATLDQMFASGTAARCPRSALKRASAIAGDEVLAEAIERSARDLTLGAAHELEVEMKIVQSDQTQS